MKDLHSHLLPGIDDGSKTIEESIDLLRKMSNEGIKEIVVTPHYIENSNYTCNNRKKKALLNKLKKKLKEENIDITLYIGNEIYFANNIVELLEKKEIISLNESKYILFEFPMHGSYKNSGEIISKIISCGYIPILAHPERYKTFLKQPNLAEEYLRMGVLLQGNYTSLFRKYGKKSEKLLKYYIKKGWISFLGSDTHHEFNYSMKKLEKKLHRINKNKDYIYDITEGNFDKVMKNESIGMIR